MEEQTTTESTTTNQAKRNVIIGITVVVLLLVLAGGTYAFVRHNQSKSPEQSNTTTPTPTVNPTITATATATPTPTSTIVPTAVTGGQLFISNSLGIYFDYSSSSSEQFVTKQVNNRVYVYDPTTTSQPSDGNQFVEVFTKDPNQTLAQAITNTILKGYNVNDCPIGDGKWDTTNLPSTYQITTIKNTSNNIGFGGNPIDPSKCPQTYVSGAGEAYFLMDANIPNKFIFLKIGQSGGANESTNTTQYPYTWNETIRIF